ncbi:MAG TPA: vWA domain-containing protein [Fimbriimonadales bacterium]|jgi:hypothetical protein|nr:vWA domain-containing protein [Fimbriimonadales bacterium]
MNQNQENRSTDLTILLDRSGSMSSIREQTIAGVNNTIQDQKLGKDGCFVTLIQFDSQNPCEFVYDGLPIEEITPLTNATFCPRASTPLYDAINLAIARTEKRMTEALKLFVIVTDGLENASRETTAEMVANIIGAKEEKGWRFLFVGANQDAILEAGKIGIHSERALTYGVSDKEILAAYDATSRVLYDLACDPSASFSEEQRKAAKSE